MGVMAKQPNIESLLRAGSAEWNKLRKSGKVGTDHTGATFAQIFSANADLSGLGLVGTEWEKCDLSKVTFRESDLANAYFHGGRLQDCDFRGANLEGCTFERVKLLRCDFSGAHGLEALELDDVDMDRVVGLNGEEAPPPPPPPVHGITSFTREQRTAAEAQLSAAPLVEPPPFRPQDPPSALFFRGLKMLGPAPAWVLDAPSLRPTVPGRLPPGISMETLYRDAVKAQLEGGTPRADSEAVKRAQGALKMGSKDAAPAALYLREVGVEPLYRFASAKALKLALQQEMDVDDLTASIDPRVTGALLSLQLPHEGVEHYASTRRRLAATQLFTALLEAGFTPEHNWQEALDASDAALELAQAVDLSREDLEEAYRTFAALPEEARLRRLAYLAEAATNLEQLSRLPEAVEPRWLTEPEYRECDDREMQFVEALKAADLPSRAAQLAQTELGIPAGTVPEDSEEDLYIRLRCAVCGKEKLLLQSP
jgi:hypothetical protein